VRRSFSVKRNDAKKKPTFFSYQAKKQYFRLFRFEAKHCKSKAIRKRMKQQKLSETKQNRKILKIFHKNFKI
jgi:hypothetical protein